MTLTRPPVSVLMPFAGTRARALTAIGALAQIDLGPEDEVVVADNSTGGVMQNLERAHLRVVPATGERSSYFARNVAAAHSRHAWMLFIDSDCLPVPTLLDDFFAEPLQERVGAVGGAVAGRMPDAGFLARYLTARGHLDWTVGSRHPYRPYAVTANLLVRRAAFDAVGGFLEGARSGADTDFCWRLQEAGWEMAFRPSAGVVHPHRERLGEFLRVSARYAAGRAWLERRYPGSFPNQPGVSAALRALAASARWAVAGEPARARERATDALVISADLATLMPNRPPGTTDKVAPADITVLLDRFPEVSETFVVSELGALKRLGQTLRIEAGRRAVRQDLGAARAYAPVFQEDDSKLERLLALLWLLRLHPVRCASDAWALRRWRREEPVPPLHVLAPLARRLQRSQASHLHVHFAAGAALSALRVKRLLGLDYSVTAHAYDIFREPANLTEKLSEANFVTTGCAYNLEHLQALVGYPAARHVHEIVMGVDHRRFRRVQAYPGGRSVLAVGRLVEKKGFRYLIEAAALLETSTPVERLVIVGDGPERATLEALIERLGLAHRLHLRGTISHDDVRRELERADLLVMPCVVAADGDRDSMPVVVKEALSLEIPVVTTDAVGLPELVRPEWGRLVTPRDPESLARAIAEVLALSASVRQAMGRAGREFVRVHCNVDGEAAKLMHLFSQASAGQSTNIR